MPVFGDLALVFLGGGLGASARFGLTRLAARLAGQAFPWGTLAVNLGGCFLIGATAGLLEVGLLHTRARPLLIVGFLGGLTTFSSYAFDSVELLRRAEWGRALANLAAQNVLGLVLAAAGYLIVARR